MSIGHYENFPVGSIIFPRRIRHAVHAIYRFARYADDVADEGGRTAELRLNELECLRVELNRIGSAQAPSTPLMSHLAETIVEHSLDFQPFHDLLSAFRQDVKKTRYKDYAELADYCRRSANPVGRLMLTLCGEKDSRALAMSDAICTALQLINILQDVELDWRKGRVYLPNEDLRTFGLSEAHIGSRDPSGSWRLMMHFQIARARKILQAGAPLGKILKGRMGFEIRLIILGGDRILKKLSDSGGDVFHCRPVLSWSDWLYMLWRAGCAI